MLRSFIFLFAKKGYICFNCLFSIQSKNSQVKCIHSFKIFVMYDIILNAKENMKTSTFETVQSEV